MKIGVLVLLGASSWGVSVARTTPTITRIFGFPANSAGTCEADGGYPQNGLIQAPNGYLYGISAYDEGAVETCPGVLFQLTASGAFSAVASLPYNPSTGRFPDGGPPFSNLVEGPDSAFYGTASSGGASNNSPAGSGTIFRAGGGGPVQVLHSFCLDPDCPDGSSGYSFSVGLDGNFYGTASEGGAGRG